jgi:hypothetical protein
VQDGAIVAGGGPLARLSYVGPISKHDFKNFELKVEVLAKPGSNGGVFFHTGPQSKFLKKGYEVQVCNSCGSKGQTGSLFVIKNLDTSPVKDDEWFEYHILAACPESPCVAQPVRSENIRIPVAVLFDSRPLVNDLEDGATT